MLIIGLLLQRTAPDQKVYGSLLKRAKMIDANDYAIYIKLYNYYMNTNRCRAAFRAATTLTEWQGVGFYPKISGHYLLIDYYKQLNDHEAVQFHQLKFKEAKDQYAYFSEDMVAL